MKNHLLKINELRHITSQEFCDKMDDFLEEVNKQDTALVIDTDRSSYVLCPAKWFEQEVLENEHFNIAITCALRYALDHPTDFADTMAMIIRESFPCLNEQTLRGMLRYIEGQLELEHDNCNRSTLEQLNTDIMECLSHFGD